MIRRFFSFVSGTKKRHNVKCSFPTSRSSLHSELCVFENIYQFYRNCLLHTWYHRKTQVKSTRMKFYWACFILDIKQRRLNWSEYYWFSSFVSGTKKRRNVKRSFPTSRSSLHSELCVFKNIYQFYRNCMLPTWYYRKTQIKSTRMKCYIFYTSMLLIRLSGV